MSLLAGLVNYSDDEGSSSGDEAPVDILQNIKKTKAEPQPKKPEAIAPMLQPVKSALPSKVPAPPSASTATMLEHNKRLMAALAAKPIAGVENWGIPNEPNTACDAERQERITHFLSLRASGHRLNDHLQHNKAFRNPRIYTKLVEFTEVDEIGSNFEKQEFDPHGFPAEMYIDGILETQRKLAEEKAAQQQNRTSVHFVPQQQQPTQQQSAAMAQAMATAAKVASRIAKPPSQDNVVVPEKRRNKWDDDQHSSKR
ncbi:uncharacterized protein ATC70_003619 [Mucor velutinosus]|uniref:HCNGP-domain-containing protein n=1 Tax=Mucor velutinosus TaxID=708070 RepID=A0AAN7DAD9_9FUNG|nr:hypothetical protein ATC70_003619 [Mucor velutinosus]